MYENTQGTETNNIIVYGNIVLGILTTALWGGSILLDDLDSSLKHPFINQGTLSCYYTTAIR